VDSNHRPLGYAYHYSFRCLAQPVCSLDFPFTLGPATPPLGCLPSSLYTFSDCLTTFRAWLGIATTGGFPEFGRCHTRVFPMCSPLQDQVPSVAIIGGMRFSLPLVSFDHVNLTGVADEHIYREDIEYIQNVSPQLRVHLLILRNRAQRATGLLHPASSKYLDHNPIICQGYFSRLLIQYQL